MRHSWHTFFIVFVMEGETVRVRSCTQIILALLVFRTMPSEDMLRISKIVLSSIVTLSAKPAMRSPHHQLSAMPMQQKKLEI